MNPNQLTKNFTLRELTESQTATRIGLLNNASPEVYKRLQALAVNVLQPLRDLLKTPIVISSGYRSPEVNRAVGGATNSEHMLGQAADLTVPGKTNIEVARLITTSGIEFNQLILEFYRPYDLHYGWVHVSYCAEGNKKEVLTYDGNSYSRGLPH